MKYSQHFFSWPVTSITRVALFASLAVTAHAADPVLPGTVATVQAANYPTIQAAIDALPASGGMVQLPAGTFEINEPLVINTGDVAIEGAGAATHIKNVNTDNKPALVVMHTKHRGQGNDRRHELWRVRIASLRITGNAKSGDGILARNINEFFVQGVTVSYHGGDGIRLASCYEDARVCDSVITYNKKVGVNIDKCHDIVVSATHFEENQDAVRCVDSFNLCMSGCNVDDHLRHGVVIENTYGSIVSSNMLEECVGTAVILDRDCYGITISANVIAHNGKGVDLRDAHGCAVSANTFTIMREDALAISANSGRIAVSGNSFSSSYIGGGKIKRPEKDQAVGGVVIDGAEGVLLSGNLFSGVDAPALVVKPGSNEPSLIADNLLIDSSTEIDTQETTKSKIERNYSAGK